MIDFFLLKCIKQTIKNSIKHKLIHPLYTTALFDDEITELQANGVHSACNLYTEAGIGFADQICDVLDACDIKQVTEK